MEIVCTCFAHIFPYERCFHEIVAILEAVRTDCVALKCIIIPDGIWDDYKNSALIPPNDAFHQHVIVLALKRGTLIRWTSPIHKYLIQQGIVSDTLTNQYRNDLRERWMFEPEMLERQKKFKIFNGKHAELQLAEWLEKNQNWTVKQLAATGGPFDIVAEFQDGDEYALEVKLIGQLEEDFQVGVNSMTSGQPICRSISSVGAQNYLVYRAFEAAKQLTGVQGKKIAVIIVSNDTYWQRYDFIYFTGGINWRRPYFLSGDNDWSSWFRSLPDQPDPNVLAEVIASLNELWILVQIEDKFEFRERFKFS